MVGEGSDPVVVPSSSIALLQERFKQLQRMKEMRQERQLLKLLTATEDKAFSPPTPPQRSEPSHLGFLCPLPHQAAASLPQLSLSLWPIQPHSRCLDSLAVPESCWLVEKEKQKLPARVKDLAHLDEVDTSLHL